MRARGLVIGTGIGIAMSAGCSLFVGLDGLSGGSDAGLSTSDAAIDQSNVTSDAATGDAAVDAGPSYQSTVLADHPLAYFRFDETTGTHLADSSGNGHDATSQGGIALGGAGAFPESGTSAHFDGTGFIGIDDSIGADDAGTAFDFADHAPFTLEAWISLDQPAVQNTNEYTFFSKEKQIASGKFHGIDFFAQPNLTLQREDDPNDETEADSASGLSAIDTWYYVVATFDGTTITIYVDLSVVATKLSSSTSLEVTDVPFIFGAETPNPSDSSLKGTMDEAAIYSSALTPTQLAAHFHAAGR